MSTLESGFPRFVWTEAVPGKKEKLRIQKCLDTCGQGLKEQKSQYNSLESFRSEFTANL